MPEKQAATRPPSSQKTGGARVSPAQRLQKRLIADTGALLHALLIRLLDLTNIHSTPPGRYRSAG
jgi:hypothetical protein